MTEIPDGCIDFDDQRYADWSCTAGHGNGRALEIGYHRGDIAQLDLTWTEMEQFAKGLLRAVAEHR